MPDFLSACGVRDFVVAPVRGLPHRVIKLHLGDRAEVLAQDAELWALRLDTALAPRCHIAAVEAHLDFVDGDRLRASSSVAKVTGLIRRCPKGIYGDAG